MLPFENCNFVPSVLSLGQQEGRFWVKKQDLGQMKKVHFGFRQFWSVFILNMVQKFRAIHLQGSIH